MEFGVDLGAPDFFSIPRICPLSRALRLASAASLRASSSSEEDEEDEDDDEEEDDEEEFERRRCGGGLLRRCCVVRAGAVDWTIAPSLLATYPPGSACRTFFFFARVVV